MAYIVSQHTCGASSFALPNFCCACRLAKERSAEDHLFGDKEKFVTAAYKKKLEEDKKWLAEEKLREAQEVKNDVVKKGHMGDFYRSVSCPVAGFLPLWAARYNAWLLFQSRRKV